MSTPVAADDQLVLTATARIRAVFSLEDRGPGIILSPEIEGRVMGPTGVIRSPKGSSAFDGPEFVDGRDGSMLAVIATAPDAIRLFAAGDTVQLFKLGHELGS